MTQTTDSESDSGAVVDEPASSGATQTEARLDQLEQDVRGYRISRDTWTMVVLGVAIAVLFASIIAIGIAIAESDDDDGGGGGGTGAAGQTITADLAEFTITLSASEVPPGSSINVTNSGSQVHNLGVTGTELITPDIQPGDTGTLDLSTLDPGTYELYCEIAGHADSGMTTPLVIAEGASGEAGEAAASGEPSEAADMGMTAEEHAAMTAEEGAARDAVMVESVMAFPAETEGKGNQPLEPEILPDGTKRFELTSSVVEWEVSPGEVVQAFAYNGQVPGPRIDLEVGDKVQVELTNEMPLGTEIHWHGIDVPNDQDGVAGITQEIVASGESYTYEFTVEEAAIGMYHAHSHGQETVPNGLFGTMYVGEVPPPAGQTVSGIEIPADLNVVQDIPMVLNDAGVIGLTLNGKSFPATEPIALSEGDWMTVTYYNEGLQVHPMHLHGFEQIVYAKDGEPLDQPYAADTVLVAPGERYTVLFNANAPGTWVWHCHILNHAESEEGLFGMVTAVVVE